MRQRTRGIRCDKCRQEVSHVIDPRYEVESRMVEHETRLAVEHRDECDGTVLMFITGDEAT